MELSERKVFVGGLYYTVDEKKLRNLFSKFGIIKGLYRSNGYPTTFAFITYKNKAQAKVAVSKMNGTMLNNRRIRVNLLSDRDKEFLDNISAESCESENESSNKKSGRNQNFPNREHPDIKNDKNTDIILYNQSQKNFERFFKLTDNESIDYKNELDFTSSVSKNFPSITNHKIRNSKENDQASSEQKNSKIDCQKMFKKSNDKSFETWVRNPTETHSESNVNSFVNHNTNCSNKAFDLFEYNFNQSQIDKNLTSSNHQFNLLEKTKKNIKCTKLTVEDKNFINSDQSQFQINEKLFQLNRNSSLKDRNSTLIRSTSLSARVESDLIVISPSPPSKFVNSNSLVNNNIDTKSNKSIEIIILD